MKAFAAILIAATVFLGGCNTIAGIGEDISDSARGVQGLF